MQYCFQASDIHDDLEQREKTFAVFFEKLSIMESNIFTLWDVKLEDRKFLEDILNSISLFKKCYYESRQKKDFDSDAILLKMGRFLCKTPYVYLDKAKREL